MISEPKPVKRLTKEQWRILIQEQQQSPLNQTEFCKSRGLCLATFHNWKKRLNISSTPPLPAEWPEWLELPVQTTTRDDTPWDIELQLPGNIVLRMRQ